MGAVVGAAAGVDLLVGLTVGAWLGSRWPWWRRWSPGGGCASTLRQRHGVASAGRGPAPHGQRLQPLEQRGDLVLHDVTLPGWPAGLEHLVIG